MLALSWGDEKVSNVFWRKWCTLIEAGHLARSTSVSVLIRCDGLCTWRKIWSMSLWTHLGYYRRHWLGHCAPLNQLIVINHLSLRRRRQHNSLNIAVTIVVMPTGNDQLVYWSECQYPKVSPEVEEWILFIVITIEHSASVMEMATERTGINLLKNIL